MDAGGHNLCLINMPVLVLEKILSNIHNPSNVARTCKHLYEIVCGIEKHRSVMRINVSRLNAEADVVFDSIMNSHRTIREMELSFDDELNERQLERINAIMKKYGANVTSFKLVGFALPINFILELLHQAPKLESLSFTWGKVMGSVPENSTSSLHLPNLKALKINHFDGLSDIVNFIPAGSLNSLRYTDQLTDSTEVFATILTKQHNIKSLTVDVRSNSIVAALCVDHLQLETLKVTSLTLDKEIKFVEILKCQTNLKELRLYCDLNASVFPWICNNLKKLEVFEVHRLHSSMEGSASKMLGQLKQLRHFGTYDGNFLFSNGIQLPQLKSSSIEELELVQQPDFSCGELLNEVVNSMAHNLPNLTHLKMKLEDFSALGLVLGHCTQIIHVSSYIRHPDPDQLTGQRFPKIQSLELDNFVSIIYEPLSQGMTSIVRAMPNLKSMSIRSGLRFDVKTMTEFIKESKCLEYFSVDYFELHRESPTDDVVETIRCLTDQLRGYYINFNATTLPNLNWRKIKNDLSNALYILRDCSDLPIFSLYKGSVHN